MNLSLNLNGSLIDVMIELSRFDRPTLLGGGYNKRLKLQYKS